MKFKMNNKNWEIEEIGQEEIKTIQNKRKDDRSENVNSIDKRYFGVTFFDLQKIYIDKNLSYERKRETLLHELVHCYIGEFITHYDRQYSEEDVADIFSKSYDIITDILEKYVKKILKGVKNERKDKYKINHI